MFTMSEVINRHDFHGFDSGLKVIMKLYLSSIVQNSLLKNSRVKTNRVKTSIYIQIIFKSPPFQEERIQQ